ncbi:hypothetical protein OPIT5_09930 [Opitutaceae bacterium TAV5]|nr:hypothetical protein OPIT5_09930 [Opitutaceae bacterium TAV5]
MRHLLLLSALGLQSLGTALAAPFGPEGSATAQPAALPPGVDVIETVFDRTPVERGLAFDRTGVKPASLTLKDGRPVDAWVCEESIEPAMRWTRSFRFTVTDPRFRQGGRPAVDLEITFHSPGFGSVRVKADTAAGARLIGSVWGNTKEWKTLRIPLDDAFFGARTDPADTAPSVNGFDLRIDGVNGPLYLRRVRLVGYDPDKDVHWPRMIKTSDLASPSTPGGVFAFTRQSGAQITARLQNLARVPRPLRYRFQVSGHDDKILHRAESSLLLAPSSTADVSLAFDPAGWPLGPCDGRLELFLDDDPAHPVYTRTFRIGIISSTTLAKARPGEFLYGLDAANNTIFPILTPAAFAWYRIMGVDILRNPWNKGMQENAADLKTALDALAAEDVQTSIMVDPPKDPDAGKRAGQLESKIAFLEETARLFTPAPGDPAAGKLRYYEMGNEPDLPHFYPAPIDTYVESYHAMYDAVKRGARGAGRGDADTVVMNGGLAFAGQESSRRAAEFVARVDASRLDAIAYHGHGPGIAAERTAWERLHTVAAASSPEKARLPFIETESGFSGVDPIGIAEQARTVVEKMTYAQSKGMPFFLYFRLFMEGAGAGIEGGYTMAENFVEPRPSILAYRHMVERLRHHRYVRQPDFAGEAGADGITAFLFEEIDAAARPAGRKTLVAFCEKPVRHELRLALGDATQSSSPQFFDLYGNTLPLSAAVASGVVTFGVGIDPVYLTWISPAAAADTAAVRVMPSLLSVDTTAPLLAGADNPLTVTVRNPHPDKPLSVTLSAEARARVAARIEPARHSVTLPVGEAVTLPLSLGLEPARQPLALPRWWTVFTDIDPARITPALRARIPATLPARTGGAPVVGRPALADGGRLNFGRLAGGFGENRTGLAYAIIDTPSAVTLDCGASGDWWMAWYLNGQPVMDTLETGNGQHGPISLHPFRLALRPGRNVLAVLVTSGRGGWEVLYGGPKELQIARATDDDPDSLALTLTDSSSGQLLASHKAPLRLQPPVPPLGDATPDLAHADTWLPLEPFAVAGRESITNEWEKDPDASRWYKGEADLSAAVWLRDDPAGNRLHLFLVATDDRHVAPSGSAAGALAAGDSFRVRLSAEAGRTLLDVTGALTGSGPVLAGAPDGVAFHALRQEKTAAADAATLYHLAIPKPLVGGMPFRVNLLLIDNDAGYPKQTLAIGDVEAPQTGLRAITQ